jgi:hypothetical protein
MPDLYSSIGQNALKTSPSTRFGTRQLQRISIYTAADTFTDYLEPNSLYSQLVRALQQNVELYAIHMPNPSFFSCWGAYCFQIDIAYDTANDQWNATNSFVDDGDPVNWYFGTTAGTDTNGQLANPMSNDLSTVVGNALEAAGESGNNYVMITWTVGDMTWPTNNVTVPGGDTPLAPRVPEASQDPDLAVAPGDTADTRLRKLAKWIKTLNK